MYIYILHIYIYILNEDTGISNMFFRFFGGNLIGLASATLSNGYTGYHKIKAKEQPTGTIEVP